MDIVVRPMRQQDLAAADQVLRLAFGTEFGLPDPMQFFGDADLIRPRWQTNPQACFVADANGRILGSVTVMNWGSVAVLGPLSIHPDYWNQGIARQLLPTALKAADAQQARLVVLFTNPASPRHLRLYESVGFTSQNLIAVMTKAVSSPPSSRALSLFSQQTAEERSRTLAACEQITGMIFNGLDLRHEIQAAVDQRVGDTVLLRDANEIVGFALCHEGPGSEAGSGTVAVKFAFVLPGLNSVFSDLIAEVEVFAAMMVAKQIQVSVNHARRVVYEIMKVRGYRTKISGVAMCRPDLEGYDTPNTLVIDEWR